MAVETQAHFRADELVQLAIRLRERRHELFGPAFNADPGWDILLRAYAARLCNERFSLVELMVALEDHFQTRIDVENVTQIEILG